MVRSTRTLDGTVSRVKYDYSSLRLRGETRTPGARPGNYRRHGTGERDRFNLELLRQPIPEPSREDICEGVNFVPPTAFGEVHSVGLSAIEHAERKIATWEIIRDSHERNLPHLLPQIDERMREAREVLQKLVDDHASLEENSCAVYDDWGQ